MQTDCAQSKTDVRTDQIMFFVHFGISSAHPSLQTELIHTDHLAEELATKMNIMQI